MFELKLQFLEDQNFALRRQVSSLQRLLAIQSEQNEKSLLYQLRRANDQLAAELQTVKDQLFLEREARQIERTEHQQIVNQLNRSIFELNQQLSLLEEVIREEKRLQYRPNCIEQWFKEKLDCAKNEVYHKYADPLLFFEVLQNILTALQENHSELFSSLLDEQIDSQPEQKEEDISSILKGTNSRMVGELPQAETRSPNGQDGQSSTLKLRGESKWAKQRSSLHFLRSKKVRDLHLNLSAAKIVQINYVRAQQQAQGKKWILNTNVDLLRKSYVVLIGQHQNLKKKNRLLSRYIEELQHRNHLLVKSRLQQAHYNLEEQ